MDPSPAHAFFEQNAPDLAALDGDALLVSGADQGVQRPLGRFGGIVRNQLSISLAHGPARGRLGHQGDELTAFPFG
jgi:hypothetical protein